MKITTSQIRINKEIKESIIENWIFNDKDVDILEKKANTNFQLTLRIPWTYKRTTNHMLINGLINFTEYNKIIKLVIKCNIAKPLILFSILGFLTSLFFIFPFTYINHKNIIIPFILGVIFSGIYFAIFFNKIQIISANFIKELVTKNLTNKFQ